MASEESSHTLSVEAQDDRAVWGAIAHLEAKLDAFTGEIRQVLTQIVAQGPYCVVDPGPD